MDLSEFHSLESEITDVSLPIEGEIPCWVNGTFVRNGPAKFSVGDKSVSHWFDGLAMLHRFSIHEGTCHYSNRFLETNDYQKMQADLLPGNGFSEVKLPASLETLETEFHPHRPNANVNVGQIDKTAVALTEVPRPVAFDLNSLETQGVIEYEDDLPKKHCHSAAHVHVIDGKTYGYLVELGRECFYVFYTLERDSKSRQLLARVPVSSPAYIHSFSVIDHYLILIDYPFRLDFEALVRGDGFIQCFKWNPQSSSHFYVIDRQTVESTAKMEGPPFFSFHHINAFEKDSSLYVDLIGYQNAEVIFGHPDENSGFYRYEINLVQEEVKENRYFPFKGELPRIHDTQFDGKPYRFFYATCFQKNITSTESPPLYKVDLDTGELKSWSLPGHFASEPVFVPHPAGKAEDDGVVLSTVTDATHSHSFLIVLDAQSFSEVARVSVPHGIPQGLHGGFYSE